MRVWEIRGDWSTLFEMREGSGIHEMFKNLEI